MDSVRMTLWNRPCQLKVIFECYGEQDPTDGQKKRLDAFLAANKEVDNALLMVKQFCLEDENMKNDSDIANIFEYVMPNSLYVKRNDEQDIIAILCDYKFDNEHGIAIVFEKKSLSEVVQQGEI